MAGVSVTGMESALRNIAAMGPALEQGMADGVLGVAQLVASGGSEFAPRNTGILASSITGQVTRRSPTGASATAGSSLVYSGVMEAGRRPGARPPPIGPIILWIAQKRRGGALDVDDDEVEGLAFAIAWSIGKRGLPALNFMARALARTQPQIPTVIAESINAAMRRMQSAP